jgi:hypothetical protein
MAKLFSDPREANLRSCITMVEEVLQSLGHKPDESRVAGEEPWPAWKVEKGSASVYILMDGRGTENFLRIVAPVMQLDPTVDRAKLNQHLLELNHGEVYGACFALDKARDLVVLLCERSTVDLDRSEVLDLVKRVEEYADKYDDILVDEFGGQKAGPSSMPVPTP